MRPRRLPCRYRPGPGDPRPGRAPSGRPSHVHRAAGLPGRRPAAGSRADQAGLAGARAVAQRPDRRDGRRCPAWHARRRFRAELHAHPAVASAAAVAADRRRHDQRAVPRAPAAGRTGVRRGGRLCRRGADVRPGPATGGSAHVRSRGTGARQHVGGGACARRHAGRAGRQRGRPYVAVLLPVRCPGTRSAQSRGHLPAPRAGRRLPRPARTAALRALARYTSACRPSPAPAAERLRATSRAPPSLVARGGHQLDRARCRCPG